MPVDNSEIAAIFDHIADLLEIGEADRFRVRACRDALAEGTITERRVRIDTAEDFADPLINWVRRLDGVTRAGIAGSYRRRWARS